MIMWILTRLVADSIIRDAARRRVLGCLGTAGILWAYSGYTVLIVWLPCAMCLPHLVKHSRGIRALIARSRALSRLSLPAAICIYSHDSDGDGDGI